MNALTWVNSDDAITAIAAAANKGATILMGTVMAVYIGRVGSAFAVSLVTTTFFLGLMVFSPVWGAVADVTGRRRAVLVTSGALAALAVLPLTFVGGVWGPLGFRLLLAVFAAGFLPVMLTIVNERGGDTGRGRAVGVFSSAAAVGFMFGQLSSGALIDLLPRSAVYVIVAALAGLVAVTCAFISNTPNDDTSVVTLSHIAEETVRRLVPTTGTDHLRKNGLSWLYLASFLRSATVLGMSGLLPVYLLHDLAVPPVWMGVILAVNPAVQIAGMYSMGRLSDRFGRKRLIILGLVGSGCYSLLLGVAMAPEGILTEALVAGAGLFTLGASYSMLQTGIVAFIGDVAPTSRESELLGLRSTARGLGGVLAPPLFGFMAMTIGFQQTFFAAALLSWVGVGLVFRHVSESYRPGGASDAPT